MKREIFFIALAAFSLPSGASADWRVSELQRVDGYFNVYGVRADDVLNIRDKPSGSGLKIGYFPYFSVAIEVMRTTPNGKWGYVRLNGELMGWVSMRYLTPATIETYGNTEIPLGLSCITTEPFINYTLSGSKILVQNGSTNEEGLYDIDRIGMERDGYYYIHYISAGNYIDTLVIGHDFKGSNGMSDVEYQWSVFGEYGVMGGCFLASEAIALPIEK